ncbi:MAG: GHKL domain-containing protein [Chloroflexi bacterium]|nr:MAG: GHKL domain-containing protein [Chloroflexota bacterium]
MTHLTVVAILGVLSTLAFVAMAALTIRDWLATREPSQMYLALAVGSLAAVSLVGQLGKVLGAGFTAASAYFTIVIFLGSGLALLLFRDSVIPLSRRTRRLVVAVVGLTAVFEIVVQAGFGRSAPAPLRFAALAAFVVVWSGCVGEPSVRLWLNARRRTAVQRARIRALSLGYLGIVAILLVAVFAQSLASQPALQVGIALATVVIVPLLYAGFAPPAWLRRIWRQGEETKFQRATQDIVMYSPDQATLANRALDWAVRLSGAESGFIVSDATTILATHGMTEADAKAVQAAVASAGSRYVVRLGGSPPRTALIAAVPRTTSSMALVGGPFTPLFGSDEEAWFRQYATLVSTGLDRVRLEEAVKKANHELEAKVREVVEQTRQLEIANRELDAFSYTISHDLRAPLRAISGFTSILFEEYADSLPTEATGYLKRVKDNGDYMGQLVDDLLAFSRLGRQALRTQKVSTRAVVDRALAVLPPSIDTQTDQLIVGELPDCDADPNLLEQVFVNLLSNAFKYSKNQPSRRIEVGARESAEGTVFFVRDNGAGFDMRYADKLFGVFQRLHRSQEYEGTGVGLAIVHRIVDRHGGRIWADAKVDQGATFYFTLKGAEEWQTAKAA